MSDQPGCSCPSWPGLKTGIGPKRQKKIPFASHLLGCIFHFPQSTYPPALPPQNHGHQLIKVGVKKKKKGGGEESMHLSECKCSQSVFFPPNPFISHKVSMVVYSNPYKRPHSPSHALKALRMHFLRGYATQSINTACHKAYGWYTVFITGDVHTRRAACWQAWFDITRFDSFVSSSSYGKLKHVNKICDFSVVVMLTKSIWSNVIWKPEWNIN